ncbi:MAG: hypothetical protein ACX93I_03970 [Winogradskyella sp.]|jgi:hypothetical protein
MKSFGKKAGAGNEDSLLIIAFAIKIITNEKRKNSFDRLIIKRK